ncbi:hypothetical protein C8R44DRAFT_843163 [Mycena epipterygia]|nr:hypothetical protein C8R44DRAFT_843163 [Mycena epipterygia]
MPPILADFKVDYTRWYASKVNPAGAVTYGGLKVPAGPPSPESAKIAESLVLIEFVAGLYPQKSASCQRTPCCAPKRVSSTPFRPRLC